MRYIILALLLVCTACAGTTPWPAVESQVTLAVAHFVHPQHDWELMAGVLPEEVSVVTQESLDALDGQLAALLEKSDLRTVLHAASVQGCEEIVQAEKERPRFETLEYWKSVGTCIKADYLLVPYVSQWQEREGGEWGVTRPASVTLDLYLIKTASGEVRRYHFEEEQQGLAENLLKGGRFFKRKGRWITPLEIAAEALEEGTRVLGL
ncbi:hypothetical protein NLA06_12450 [Desulfomicrobium sp. ZS1]|jgi:hypothetical protein|uniref:hypothetical protein n=1 Tax=Desulfomicrobium sp. ZS1 TaxID=2952228 RepID=UPI0020B28743|nr:hypothetical protein [Desulfomicrobium sp. ZS1]UTF49367.1 hypothetical protein NLA06_12450 [Desulfomicrobium sp. ZS1]